MKKKPTPASRTGKSNVAIRNLLNNLKENELHYENKQITQCVFLGVLRLKPVPSVFNNLPSTSTSVARYKPRQVKNNNNNNTEVNKNSSKTVNNKVINGKVIKKNTEKVKACVKKNSVKNIIKVKFNMHRNKDRTTLPNNNLGASTSTSDNVTFNPVDSLFNKMKQQRRNDGANTAKSVSPNNEIMSSTPNQSRSNINTPKSKKTTSASDDYKLHNKPIVSTLSVTNQSRCNVNVSRSKKTTTNTSLHNVPLIPTLPITKCNPYTTKSKKTAANISQNVSLHNMSSTASQLTNQLRYDTNISKKTVSTPENTLLDNENFPTTSSMTNQSKSNMNTPKSRRNNTNSFDNVPSCNKSFTCIPPIKGQSKSNINTTKLKNATIIISENSVLHNDPFGTISSIANQPRGNVNTPKSKKKVSPICSNISDKDDIIFVSRKPPSASPVDDFFDDIIVIDSPGSLSQKSLKEGLDPGIIIIDDPMPSAAFDYEEIAETRLSPRERKRNNDNREQINNFVATETINLTDEECSQIDLSKQSITFLKQVDQRNNLETEKVTEKPKARRNRLMPAIPEIFLNTRMLLRSEFAQKKDMSTHKSRNKVKRNERAASSNLPGSNKCVQRKKSTEDNDRWEITRSTSTNNKEMVCQEPLTLKLTLTKTSKTVSQAASSSKNQETQTDIEKLYSDYPGPSYDLVNNNMRLQKIALQKPTFAQTNALKNYDGVIVIDDDSENNINKALPQSNLLNNNLTSAKTRIATEVVPNRNNYMMTSPISTKISSVKLTSKLSSHIEQDVSIPSVSSSALKENKKSTSNLMIISSVSGDSATASAQKLTRSNISPKKAESVKKRLLKTSELEHNFFLKQSVMDESSSTKESINVTIEDVQTPRNIRSALSPQSRESQSSERTIVNEVSTKDGALNIIIEDRQPQRNLRSASSPQSRESQSNERTIVNEVSTKGGALNITIEDGQPQRNLRSASSPHSKESQRNERTIVNEVSTKDGALNITVEDERSPRIPRSMSSSQSEDLQDNERTIMNENTAIEDTLKITIEDEQSQRILRSASSPQTKDLQSDEKYISNEKFDDNKIVHIKDNDSKSQPKSLSSNNRVNLNETSNEVIKMKQKHVDETERTSRLLRSDLHSEKQGQKQDSVSYNQNQLLLKTKRQNYEGKSSVNVDIIDTNPKKILKTEEVTGGTISIDLLKDSDEEPSLVTNNALQENLQSGSKISNSDFTSNNRIDKILTENEIKDLPRVTQKVIPSSEISKEIVTLPLSEENQQRKSLMNKKKKKTNVNFDEILVLNEKRGRKCKELSSRMLRSELKIKNKSQKDIKTEVVVLIHDEPKTKSLPSPILVLNPEIPDTVNEKLDDEIIKRKLRSDVAVERIISANNIEILQDKKPDIKNEKSLRSSAKTVTPVLSVFKKTDENVVQNINNSNKFVKMGTNIPNIVSPRSLKSLRSENIQRDLLKNDPVSKKKPQNEKASKHSSEDKKENKFKKSVNKPRKGTKSRLPLIAKALSNVQTNVKAAKLRVTKLTANRKLKKNILNKIDQANKSKAKSKASPVKIVEKNIKCNKVTGGKVQKLKEKKPSKVALKTKKLKVKPVKKITKTSKKRLLKKPDKIKEKEKQKNNVAKKGKAKVGKEVKLTKVQKKTEEKSKVLKSMKRATKTIMKEKSDTKHKRKLKINPLAVPEKKNLKKAKIIKPTNNKEKRKYNRTKKPKIDISKSSCGNNENNSLKPVDESGMKDINKSVGATRNEEVNSTKNKSVKRKSTNAEDNAKDKKRIHMNHKPLQLKNKIQSSVIEPSKSKDITVFDFTEPEIEPLPPARFSVLKQEKISKEIEHQGNIKMNHEVLEHVKQPESKVSKFTKVSLEINEPAVVKGKFITSKKGHGNTIIARKQTRNVLNNKTRNVNMQDLETSSTIERSIVDKKAEDFAEHNIHFNDQNLSANIEDNTSNEPKEKVNADKSGNNKKKSKKLPKSVESLAEHNLEESCKLDTSKYLGEDKNESVKANQKLYSVIGKQTNTQSKRFSKKDSVTESDHSKGKLYSRILSPKKSKISPNKPYSIVEKCREYDNNEDRWQAVRGTSSTATDAQKPTVDTTKSTQSTQSLPNTSPKKSPMKQVTIIDMFTKMRQKTEQNPARNLFNKSETRPHIECSGQIKKQSERRNEDSEKTCETSMGRKQYSVQKRGQSDQRRESLEQWRGLSEQKREQSEQLREQQRMERSERRMERAEQRWEQNNQRWEQSEQREETRKYSENSRERTEGKKEHFAMKRDNSEYREEQRERSREQSIRRETPSVPKDEQVKGSPSIGDEEDSDCESRMEWIPEEYAEYMFKYSAKKMMNYKPSFKCKVCLLIFPTYHILNRHKAKHMEVEKPYKCQYCEEAFSDVVDLSAHIRVHKGKYPYTCRKCGEGFWTKSALDTHKPRHILIKLKPPEKKFRCDVCAKEFSKLSDVERHIRVHTGEKPSVCNICNRRFQQAFNLSKHLLTHLGIKPFTCEICNKQFGRTDILDRHILTHSVNKPLKCQYCTKGFIRPSQLSHHIKKCHPGEKDTGNADDERKQETDFGFETSGALI